MGYLDSSDAQLIALTRQRRAEAAGARLALRPEPARYSATDAAFTVAIKPLVRVVRRPADEERMRVWKARQWAAGARWCGYCEVRMTRVANKPNTATVDHVVALGMEGDDAAHNWMMACNRCNARKGLMSETSFRTLLAAEGVLAA